jgi:acyl carrier protein
MSNDNIVNAFFSVVNSVKKTAFTADIIGLDFHLGGDLGIDSREMLEIWYDLEKELNIHIPDGEKRDRYTVQDVIDLLEQKVEAVPA